MSCGDPFQINPWGTSQQQPRRTRGSLQPRSAPIIEEIMRAGVTSHNQIVAKLNERNVNTTRGQPELASDIAKGEICSGYGVSNLTALP